MFEDHTPEARLMGVEGERTYPHNSLVEAAYSLGALGLVAYVVFVGSAVAAALSVMRTRPRCDQSVALLFGLGAFSLRENEHQRRNRRGCRPVGRGHPRQSCSTSSAQPSARPTAVSESGSGE